VKHAHGTPAAYAHDACRCEACRRAAVRAMKRTRHLRAHGIYGYTDPTGTRRRIEALNALGWTAKDVADRIGTTKQAVSEMRRGTRSKRTTPAVAARVAAVYDELSMTRPDGWVADRTRRTAAARGYAPPLAWDDDEIDDPHALPHMPHDVPWTRELAPCGTPAAYRRHIRHGERPCGSCARAESRRRGYTGSRVA
jgi:transcriptional regulator with XRE-family HTH domain